MVCNNVRRSRVEHESTRVFALMANCHSRDKSIAAKRMYAQYEADNKTRRPTYATETSDCQSPS